MNECKFKVGNTVKVYEAFSSGTLGTVRTVFDKDDTMLVVTPDGGEITTHFKQCRRLVKKPRRRVWIPQKEMSQLEKLSGKNAWCGLNVSLQKMVKDDVEFIEVKKPKEPK